MNYELIMNYETNSYIYYIILTELTELTETNMRYPIRKNHENGMNY